MMKSILKCSPNGCLKLNKAYKLQTTYLYMLASLRIFCLHYSRHTCPDNPLAELLTTRQPNTAAPSPPPPPPPMLITVIPADKTNKKLQFQYRSIRWSMLGIRTCDTTWPIFSLLTTWTNKTCFVIPCLRFCDWFASSPMKSSLSLKTWLVRRSCNPIPQNCTILPIHRPAACEHNKNGLTRLQNKIS